MAHSHSPNDVLRPYYSVHFFKIRKILPPLKTYLDDLSVNKEEWENGRENILSPTGQVW